MALLLASAIVCVAIAMVSGIAMLGHLQGGNAELMKAIMLGPFCPREVFTATGWRYRNRAMVTGLVGFVAFASWAYLHVFNR